MPAQLEPDAAIEAVAKPEYQSACEPFVVVGQDIELEINFRDKSIVGVSTLLIFPLVDGLEEVSIDARQCHIDTEHVYVDGVRTRAWFDDPYDLLDLPQEWQLGPAQHQVMMKRIKTLLPQKRPDVPIKEREELMTHSLGCVPNEGALKISLRKEDMRVDEADDVLRLKPSSKPDEERIGIKISIPFRSKRIRDGLHFVGVDEGDSRYPHVYTRHGTSPGTASAIFPCIDDPGQRHLFKVSLKCPRTLGDALQQALVTQQAPEHGVNEARNRRNGEAVVQPVQSLLIEEDKLLEMTVICSGNLTGEQIDPDDERKKIISFECQNASAQHVGFAVGPFEHVALWSEYRSEESDEKLGSNATKVHGYCLPGRADEVRNTCAPLVAAADYFALEFGRFPFDSYKICFVEDMVSETAVATSLSLCSTRLLYLEDIIDTEIESTRTLVHSLASQYLGVHIVPDQRSDTWLVVGIQWYMTDLFMRTICGLNWYKFHLKTLSDKLVASDVGRPSLHDLGEYLYVGDFERHFMALKAPLVLYILDQRMSKYPGSTGVARVVSHMVSAANISNTDAKETSVSADDFRRSCEKKSAYRPETFWHQWIHGAGCPKLAIKQKFNKKNLNVDIVIMQTQGNPGFQKAQLIRKEDFWREYQEDIHNVFAGDVQKIFTGPLTVRIHEADGTPYEHYLDIRDDEKHATSWSIPYNTKYKRLKRKGRQKEPGNVAANIDGKDAQDDDVVYFNMLGDVLLGGEDMGNWGLQDWEADVQNAMDQESYEWIRFDCNFEWLCDITTDMPGYMYLAQLQQDRDVVAHQDAMLFWLRGLRHPVASSIETRTLYDKRYYHGIRTMAVKDLPKQAAAEQNYIGLAHLILAFRNFFCFKVSGNGGVDTWPPAPNNFSDKAQYAIQSSIPAAIARVRSDAGRCPKSARGFLLDLLLFNDNSHNDFSDHFYTAKLLEALTTSLIVESYDEPQELIYMLKPYEDDDVEFKHFIDKTLEEIDRYRRMDEWNCSYQNIWTTTALDCKKKLMKARVIPVAPLEFLQYLQDDNTDVVRIKAFQCLVELGMLSKPAILKLLLAAMSTDESPLVRDRLFKIFCEGIASIAFGENQATEKPASPQDINMDDDGGLIIEQGDAITATRQALQARRENISAALAALKEELKGDVDLQLGIWRAFESPVIGLEEKRNILELCQAMFEPEDGLLVTFKYPKIWKAERASDAPAPGEKKGRKRTCIINFTSSYRDKPRNPIAWEETLPLPPPGPLVSEVRPPETKKIKLQSRPSFAATVPAGAAIPATPTLVRHLSISVDQSPSLQTAIDVSPLPPPIRTSAPVISPPLPEMSPWPNGVRSAQEQQKAPQKRRSEDSDFSDRPTKMPKTASSGRATPTTVEAQRRVVKVKFTKWDKLPDGVRQVVKPDPVVPIWDDARGGTIVATPVSSQSRSAPPLRTSSSPTIEGSPISAAASGQNTSPMKTVAAGASGAAKPARKPLPSSAKNASQSVLGIPAVAASVPASTSNSKSAVVAPVEPEPASHATASAAAPARPKTVIKLKLSGLKKD